MPRTVKTLAQEATEGVYLGQPQLNGGSLHDQLVQLRAYISRCELLRLQSEDPLDKQLCMYVRTYTAHKAQHTAVVLHCQTTF